MTQQSLNHSKRLSSYQITVMMLSVILLWGLNVVMLKYLTKYFPPLALAGIRMTLAAAFLLPTLYYPNGRRPVPKGAWWPICGVALFSIVMHQITLSLGISSTSATHGALILALNPLTTTLAASLLVNEPLNWSKSIGVAFGLSGVLLIITGKTDAGQATTMGDSLMLIAMLTYVAGSLCVKKGTEYTPPLIITAYSHLIAAPVLLLINATINPIWVNEGAFELLPIAILLFSSWFSTALGALLWNTGVHHIGASTASLFLNGSPIVSLFASAVFLDEQLIWKHYVALILVLLGVSLGTGTLTSWITKEHTDKANTTYAKS